MSIHILVHLSPTPLRQSSNLILKLFQVTVNLRCGFNETRRLVFKSAKTCECFFCKHV